jgi:hypothetical protein
MPRGEKLKGKPKSANSGLKKGQKIKATLLKEELEKTLKERYLETMGKALPKVKAAQLQLALGSSKLFAKVPYSDGVGGQKTRLELIENDQLIIDILSDEKLTKDKDYFILTNIPPNHNSQAYILDQIIGKSASLIGEDKNNQFKSSLIIETNVIPKIINDKD